MACGALGHLGKFPPRGSPRNEDSTVNRIEIYKIKIKIKSKTKINLSWINNPLLMVGLLIYYPVGPVDLFH